MAAEPECANAHHYSFVALLRSLLLRDRHISLSHAGWQATVIASGSMPAGDRKTAAASLRVELSGLDSHFFVITCGAELGTVFVQPRRASSHLRQVWTPPHVAAIVPAGRGPQETMAAILDVCIADAKKILQDQNIVLRPEMRALRDMQAAQALIQQEL